MDAIALDATDRRLIDGWQRGFPLVPRPYAAVAESLDIAEDELLARLERLRQAGVISRVGATVRPNTAGASTLAAMAVTPGRLDEVAALVSAAPEVTHNYEREHRFNLWFVVTAADRAGVGAALARLAAAAGLPAIELPLEAEYRIDLGFDLTWA